MIRYKPFLLTAALLLIGLMSLSLVSSALEVSDGIAIAQTDANEDEPEVAVDSRGDFHVVYESYDFDTESGKLEYLKISSTPSILEGPITLSGSNVDRIIGYEIAVDSSDQVHVVFTPQNDDESGEIHYAQLSRDGKIVVPAKRIYDSPSYSGMPSLDTDRYGNVYITWVRGGNPDEIMWMKLSSSGSVLEPGKVISNDLNDDEQLAFPGIGVSPAGNCYIVWNFLGTVSTGEKWTIYFTSLSSSGEVDVGPTQILSNLAVTYWGVKAALDSGYNLHLTFMLDDRIRGYAVGYARVDEEGNVDIEERLDDPPRTGMAWWPDIDVNPSDDIYVAYQMLRNDFEGYWNIYLLISENGGSSWEPSLQLTPNGVSQGPVVAAGSGVAGIAHGYQHEDIHFVVVSEEGTNNPPVADLSVSSENPTIGESVEFDGSNSYDPDDNDQVNEWFFDFGDGNDSGWVTTARVNYGNGYDEAGTYTASLRVRDTYGLESENVDTVTIQVGSTSTNLQPLAKLIAIPDTADIGEEIVFNGGISVDPDGSVAQFNFDFGDGTTTGWVTQDYQYHSFDSEGIYQAVLVVRDNEGSESEPAYARVTIIHVNEVPTATIVSIEPSLAMEGEDVTLTGTGEDADGTIETFTWESDKDGIFGNTAIVTINTLSVGSHTIAFKVRDDEDVWSKTVTETLVVLKNQEFILEDQTRKREVKTDGEMHFRVIYTDPEGDPPTLFNLLYAKGNVWKEVRLLEADTDDQDLTDGKEYYYIRTFGPGTWEFAFEFENEINLRQTTDVEKFEVEEDQLFPIPAGGTPGVLMAMLVVALALVLRRHD